METFTEHLSPKKEQNTALESTKNHTEQRWIKKEMKMRELLAVENITVEKQVDLFLDQTKLLCSKSTYKTYESKLRTFIRWWESQTTISSMKNQLLQYREHLKSNYGSGSINTLLSVVRTFFKFLLENEFISTNPATSLKNVKVSDEHSKSSLDKYQLLKLTDHLKKDTTLRGQRDRLIILLGISNGLRVNEIANINLEDIQMKEGNFVIYLLRKGYDTKVNYTILQPRTHQLIMDYLESRGDKNETALFESRRGGNNMTADNISRIIKKKFRAIGLDTPSLSAHSLRHSFSVLALEAGVSVVDLMTSLNHKGLSTTMVYLRSRNRANNSAEKSIDFEF